VASAYALLAPWKSLVRGDRPLPSFSPGEAAPWRAVDSERTAPLEPRPAVGVPVGARVLDEGGTDSLGVYRPRRSKEDGLPILQLEPLADEEGADSLGGYGSRKSAEDDLPILQLEPLDDEEGRDSFGGSKARRPTDDAPEIILEPLDDEVATEPAASRLAGPAPREMLKPLLAKPWTRRLVVMSGLVAGGLFAALTFETWVPKAASFGRMVVSEIDRLTQSGAPRR
jgi:hypothetical protein